MLKHKSSPSLLPLSCFISHLTQPWTTASATYKDPASNLNHHGTTSSHIFLQLLTCTHPPLSLSLSTPLHTAQLLSTLCYIIHHWTTDIERVTHGHINTDTHTQNNRGRHKQKIEEDERDGCRHKERQISRDRQANRKRQTSTDRQRQNETGREKQIRGARQI